MPLEAIYQSAASSLGGGVFFRSSEVECWENSIREELTYSFISMRLENLVEELVFSYFLEF